MNDHPYPKSVADEPINVQIAVLYERVGSLSDDVRSMKRAFWGTTASVVGGAILFLFAEASGWIGPHKAQAAAHFILGFL